MENSVYHGIVHIKLEGYTYEEVCTSSDLNNLIKKLNDILIEKHGEDLVEISNSMDLIFDGNEDSVLRILNKNKGTLYSRGLEVNTIITHITFEINYQGEVTDVEHEFI